MSDRFDLIDALAAMLAERGKIVAVRAANTDEWNVKVEYEDIERFGFPAIPDYVIHLPAEIGRPCETCNGGGQVTNHGLASGYVGAKFSKCPDCGGSGIMWAREY